MAYQIFCDGYLLHDSRLDEPRLLNPAIDLVVNTVGEFVFDMLAAHPYYDVVNKLSSVVTVYEVGKAEPLFKGRVLDDDPIAYDKTKTVKCEGDLAYLNDMLMRPWDFAGDVPEMLALILSEYNSQQPDASKRLEMGIVTVTDPNQYIVRSSEETLNCFEVLRSRLFESSLGGYVKVRGTSARYLDYTKESGKKSGQVLRFGENILDLKQYVNGADVATALLPYGAEYTVKSYPNGAMPAEPPDGWPEGAEPDPEDYPEVETTYRTDITSVNGGLDYIVDSAAEALFGRIYATVTWDDVALPQNLIQRAWDWLAEHALLSMTIELNALDLHLLDSDIDAFALGDYVRVISEPHAIDTEMQVTKMHIDLQDPSQTTITLGFSTATLTEHTVSAIAKAADQVTQTVTNNLQGSVSSMVSLMVGDAVKDGVKDAVNDALSGADLSGSDLSGADLSGGNFSGADLSGADLSGSDFAGADLLSNAALQAALQQTLQAALAAAAQAAAAAQEAQDIATGATNAATAAQNAAQAASAQAQTAKGAADSAAADAANAAGIATGKGDVLIQSATPGAAYQKDTTLWIDTTAGANTPKRWSGSAWVAVTDKAVTDAAASAATAQNAASTAQGAANTAASDAAAAQAAATSAQNTANTAKADAATAQGKADAATSAAAGAQSTANTAKSDAATAQSTANAAANAAQDAKSAADTAKSNALTAQQTADAAKSNAQAAQSSADTAKANAQAAQDTADSARTDAQTASEAAAIAAGIANGKGDVIIQSEEPATDMRKQTTLWIDTTAGANTPKKWDGGAWVVLTDKAATEAAVAAVAAHTAAIAAQSAADDAQAAAWTAQVTADDASAAAWTAQITADDAQAAAATAQQAADDAQADVDSLGDTVGEVQVTVANLSSTIEQTATDILLAVEQEYATRSALAETDDRLSSQIQIQADNVTTRFAEEHSLTSGIDADLQQYKTSVSGYIRESIDGIEIGKSNSPFVAKLSNEELAFIQNGNKVAYISDSKLLITDANVLNSLTIGHFAFIPHENGSMSVALMGGSN